MISVVIPTLNAQATLAATLTALVPAAVDGLVREVIVVDGGSTDQTAAIVEDAGAQLVCKSGGRGHQLTVGALRAKQPWLLFLHADTVLAPAGNGKPACSWSAPMPSRIAPPRQYSALRWTTSAPSRGCSKGWWRRATPCSACPTATRAC